MSDTAQDYLDSGGTTANPLTVSNALAATSVPSSDDAAQAFLDSGGKTPHPLAAVADKKAPDFGSLPQKASLYPGDVSNEDWGASIKKAWNQLTDRKGSTADIVTAAPEAIGSLASGLTAPAMAGVNQAYNYATGKAPQSYTDLKNSWTYRPDNKFAQDQTNLVSSLLKPVGDAASDVAGIFTKNPDSKAAIGDALQYAAPLVKGAPYSLEDITSGAKPDPSVVAEVPARSSLSPRPTPKAMPAANTPALSATGAERTPYFDINDPQSADELGIKPERQEDPKQAASTGDLSADQQQARMDLAKRLGLMEVRKSAIEGNAQDAADDFDSTKYTGDPTGDRMRAVIGAEQTALTKHAEGIVENAGGSPGTDQSSNINTGRTIAQPFDDLRDFINDQKKQMYAAGRQRLGSAPIETTNLDAALNDPGLKNSLMAQGKDSLLKGAQAQLDHFKDNNGGALNVSTAEKYRQFVNTLWGTDKNAVGKLTDAIDSDVGNAVGEDVFAPARALHGLGKDLLENPDGVSDLFDKDPRKGSPNRSTSFEDIPDKLANLDGAQFQNVMDTLHNMPEELQPQSQAAQDAIRAHMANRLLDAGTKTSGQWNKKGVNNELRNNSENFKTAFADRPDLAADIKDLKDGGEMLRFNAAYRGAHAQASNMIRQGVGAGAEWAGAGAGSALGTFVGGPGIPTAVGAMAGRAAVAKGLTSLRNRSLRKDVESRIVKLDQ
jgi:hypothetical protein